MKRKTRARKILRELGQILNGLNIERFIEWSNRNNYKIPIEREAIIFKMHSLTVSDEMKGNVSLAAVERSHNFLVETGVVKLPIIDILKDSFGNPKMFSGILNGTGKHFLTLTVDVSGQIQLLTHWVNADFDIGKSEEMINRLLDQWAKKLGGEAVKVTVDPEAENTRKMVEKYKVPVEKRGEQSDSSIIVVQN